jgi:hypothetical protein
MANEFIARKGLIVPSGSIYVTSGSVTASNFLGTASNAISSSFAITASYALNASGGSGFPFSGSAVITGSLNVTQGVTASYFAGDGRYITNINAAITLDTYQFDADGVTTSYILSQSYYSVDSIFVTVGGVSYAPDIDYTYTSSTKQLNFSEAPPSQSNVVIRVPLSVGNALSSSFTGSFNGDGSGLKNLPTSLAIDNYIFIGDGSTQSFVVSSSYEPKSLFITVGGLRYINDNDYTVSSNTIQFVQPPASESIVLIQAFIGVSSGSTGTFSGSFIGTATTASFASNVLKTKAGSVVNTSFGGTPLTASVTFSTAFDNTNYAIAITGEDSRAWVVQSKTASGFVINSVSNTALIGTTYWTCTAYGEN